MKKAEVRQKLERELKFHTEEMEKKLEEKDFFWVERALNRALEVVSIMETLGVITAQEWDKMKTDLINKRYSQII